MDKEFGPMLNVYLNGDESETETETEATTELPEKEETVTGKVEEKAEETVEAPATKDDNNNNEEPDKDEKPETENESEKTEDSTELEIDGETSEEQSKDKDNPANKAFRELRTGKEESDKIVAEIKTRQESLDNSFKELALANGYKNITNAEEYLKAVREQQGIKKYEASKDPKDLIDTIKQNLMDEFKPLINKADEALKSTGESKADNELQKQVDELNKEYGTEIEKFDDVSTLPNAGKVIDYLAKDLSLKDAYFLANKDTITEKTTKAAKQSAINKAKGFDHVKKASNANTVNKDQLTQDEINNNLSTWKSFFPDAKESKIKEMMVAAKKNGEL